MTCAFQRRSPCSKYEMSGKKDIVVALALLMAIIVVVCKERPSDISATRLTSYVDPYIGSDGHGHVFVGANVPFGFVQLGPTQMTQGWDWCSGYHYSDSTIIGFGHLHLSGTGIGDLGDVAFMPVVGEVKTSRGSLPDPSSGIYSFFSHDRESVRPGFYSVHLDRYGIDVALTATPRVGFHKYTFPASDNAGVIIDLEQGIGWDAPVEGYITMESDTVVAGWRRSKGWARDQWAYFYAVFSKPMKRFAVYDSTAVQEGTSLKSRKVYGRAFFDSEKDETIYVKVGMSAVSIENAAANIAAELPGWDFNETVTRADEAWNRELEKVQVTMEDASHQRTFYTALYHTMIAPSVFSDVNGEYRGSDGRIHRDTTFTNYTTFSLWDTYRAAQPLMTLIHPEKMPDMVKTWLNIYRQQGKLPVWHLMGNETDCMVGNPGIPVLADAVLKGYSNDFDAALEAMTVSANRDERGMKLLREYGYIPYDLEPTHESVAKTMEYALADWCVAEVAARAGQYEVAKEFRERSRAYRRFFDPKTKFMRGLSSEGEFREPFNPFHSAHMADDYCEGNAWQYTWLVPHDVVGLIQLFEGENAFISRLDSLFVVEGDMGEEASADITGLIGQYAHGNEPSHHVAYLYAWVGQPWKTAERVRQILTTLYSDRGDGLSGNEDVGQMSAWYIMSSLGFYQVEPAGGKYIFGSPLVQDASVKVGDNKTLRIIAKNNSDTNRYIQSVTLNGEPYTRSYITHDVLTAGGELVFEMGDTPSTTFGVAPGDRPSVYLPPGHAGRPGAWSR